MGGNMYSFLCVLSRWWRTSLELAPYQDQGRNLTWRSISPCKASPERILWRCSLNLKGTFNTVYPEWSRCTLQSTNNPLTLVLRCDSKGEWRGVQAGGWGKAWGRCFVTTVQTGQMKFYCLGNHRLSHLPLWPQIPSKQSFLQGSWCCFT